MVVDQFAQDIRGRAGHEQIRLGDLATSLVEHSGEVYGQLTVYYRAAGMIPPEARPKIEQKKKQKAPRFAPGRRSASSNSGLR